MFVRDYMGKPDHDPLICARACIMAFSLYSVYDPGELRERIDAMLRQAVDDLEEHAPKWSPHVKEEDWTCLRLLPAALEGAWLKNHDLEFSKAVANRVIDFFSKTPGQDRQNAVRTRCWKYLVKCSRANEELTVFMDLPEST